MRWLLLSLLCVGVVLAAGVGDVTLKSDALEATVGADGCLISLKPAGVEFVVAKDGFPRGGYLYQNGLLKLATVTHPEPNVVLADDAKGAVRYQLDGAKLTLTLTNKTAQEMLWVAVLDKGVDALQGGPKTWAKPAVERGWPVATIYRGTTSLRWSGGTRLWGPWGEGNQIWQTNIKANSEVKVEIEANTATPEELAKARQMATQPVYVPTDPVGPMWDLKRFSSVPKTWPAEGFKDDVCRAVYFEGPPYQGNPTKVFAWIGLPKVEPGTKVPAMVLVHGGGGTAFAEWVHRWTSRGYAAIAMDTCGCVPRGTYGNWDRNPEGGPAGWGGWGQSDEPREDQWTFHAVADTLLAHSLLRSLPEVDPDRIGLTGISWGGYLACILAGVDTRLKCVVPVYGCGFTNEHSFAGSVNSLGPERAARWMRWWDPSVYLPQATMPMAWVTGTNDFAYTFNALQKSYRLPKGPRTLCIRLRMPHGHGDAGEGPAEIFAFADQVLRGGDAMARVSGTGRDGRRVWTSFESKHPVTHADLMITKDKGPWPDRKWEALPAVIDGQKVTSELPEGVTVWYLNLFDDRNLCVSTEHEEL